MKIGREEVIGARVYLAKSNVRKKDKELQKTD